MTHTEEILQRIDEICKTALDVLQQPESTARNGVLFSLLTEARMILVPEGYDHFRFDLCLFSHGSSRDGNYESWQPEFDVRESENWRRMHGRCMDLMAVFNESRRRECIFPSVFPTDPRMKG